METLKSLNGNSFRWSLPCDVNSSVVPARGCQFLEEARKNRAMKDKEYSDIESLETQRLLDHDSLAQDYEEETKESNIVPPRYTSRATLQITPTPVDDPIPFQDLDSVVETKKPYDVESLQSKVLHSKYSVYIPTYKSPTEEKKVDENGNALHQNPTKAKKKKIQTDKNVVVLAAESVEGHRSDIINDVEKLIQFIGGDKDNITSGKTKSNLHKSKQLKQHSEDSTSQKKKQRAHSSRSKEGRSELKKSNSLGEISTAKLDNFAFVEKEENKVVLRNGKIAQTDRPKERRSWGNVDPPHFQILSSNASVENLDTPGNWVVTKPKKKSKKRRNSISSGRRQNSSSESNKQPTNRAPSPDLRAKSIRSVPHSEKSNDSSDADSVHSLPIDGLNTPISYADIAKNSEKLKDKKVSPEKPEKVQSKENSPKAECDLKPLALVSKKMSEKQVSNSVMYSSIKNSPPTPPDVTNMKSFPAMPHDSKSTVSSVENSEVISLESLKSNSLPDVQLKTVVDVSPMDISLKNILISSPEAPSEKLPNSDSHYSKIIHDSKSVSNPLSPPNPTPPDVHNFRSFPAMPNPNSKTLSVEKVNAKNVSVAKTRNISPSTRSVQESGASNNHIKETTESSTTIQSDIQNDLTILHSNERESIHINAQMLPPDIPDVRTIEKMHFMNLSSPPKLHQHNQNTPINSQVPMSEPSPAKPFVNSFVSNNRNCDSSERTEGLPPVVILSGIGNKEVPGLVFGFDLNEALLKEDVCENFISRYVAPENFKNSTHNHDKIVNFIGSTWEAIVNQSNGKVQYYKEGS